MTGIYKITNLLDNKVYIGQALNIDKRWKEHQAALKHNKHQNKHLQNAWNKYGEENFKFEVIEECIKYLLNEEGIKYVKYYNANNVYFGYNQTIGGESTFGYKHTDKTKAKLSSINKKRLANPENHPLYGKHHTEETKEKIRQDHLGTKASLETRQKQSKVHKGTIWIHKGKITKMIHPEDLPIYTEQGFIKGRGENTSDIVNRVKVIQLDLEGNFIREFNSIKDATQYFNKVGSLIGACIRGNRKTAYGYIWKRSTDYYEE